MKILALHSFQQRGLKAMAQNRISKRRLSWIHLLALINSILNCLHWETKNVTYLRRKVNRWWVVFSLIHCVSSQWFGNNTAEATRYMLSVDWNLGLMEDEAQKASLWNSSLINYREEIMHRFIIPLGLPMP